MARRVLTRAGHQRGHLWTDELPDIACFAAPFRQVHTARGAGNPVHTKLAVEVYIPRGAITSTGMLGLVIEPATRAALLVPEVLLLGGCFAGLYRFDPLYVGLQPELLAGVIEGARSVVDWPTGTVQVACAAFSEVGSSHALFANMAAFLLRASMGGSITEQAIADLTR